MNTYMAYYNGKTIEFYSTSLWAAKQHAIEKFKVPKSKQGLLAVVLAAVNGQEVEISTAAI